MNDYKTISWLHTVRAFELQNSLSFFNQSLSDKSVLEIGSGNGFQLKLLKEHSRNAIGVDVPTSTYIEKVCEIVIYNGFDLPFPDSSFDVVFSSNVLEHIKDISAFHREIRRVLKDDGMCLHIIPSHFWKLWTNLWHYPWVISFLMQIIIKMFTEKTFTLSLKNGDHTLSQERNESKEERRYFTLRREFLSAFFPLRHGERGNLLSECYYLHPKWWERRFIKDGFTVKQILPTGLFYWGHDFLRLTLSIKHRKILAKYLGSACYTYILAC